MNKTISVLVLIIVTSFFSIVVLPTNSDNSSITVVKSLRGGKSRRYPKNFNANFHRFFSRIRVKEG